MSEKNRVAIYCRLSKDDEQSGESVSIETQKMMLTKYCADHGFEIFDIYIDDGYSGLNFERPSFKRLIYDLEMNQFNIVVTKDLSRLGRDYIQTGYYIDVYFATKNVRYIAVNDGIDTMLDNNDIAPFKNILNDMYAKDLSRKVKSAKQQRAQNGFYISAQPPYGYKVDPCNRNKLIVDSESADTVKFIFDCAYSGKNFSEISRILGVNKVITPAAYKALHGDTRFLKYVSNDQLYKWHYQTVKSILCNPVYMGDMVNHKVETVNYKTKKRVPVPVEEQIVVQNTHAPIIDRGLFEAVQEKVAHRRVPNHCYDNVFKGRIFCDWCGAELQLISKKLKKESVPMYHCMKHIKDTMVCPHNHFIYYNDLLNEVKNQLIIQITENVCPSIYNELCNRFSALIQTRIQEMKNVQLQKELQALNKNIKEQYKLLGSNEVIPELETLHKNRQNLMRALVRASAKAQMQLNIDTNILKETINECLYQCIADGSALKLLVKKIEIGHLERDASGVKQKIKISYRFEQKNG